MKNYQELKVWQLGMEIVKGVFPLSKKLPKIETYGLISQMTRAAVSIPANIAEGSSRSSDRDNARFLKIALGSVFELQTYFILIRDLGWVSKNEVLEGLLEQEIKMIHGLLRVMN